MMYGKPAVNVDRDDEDNVGLRTLVLSQMWSVPSWPMPLTEYATLKPAIPDVGTGMILVGRQTRRHGGAMRTVWVFDGVSGDGKSVTFRTRANSLDYRFDPGFSERPIALHPRIQALLDQYHGSPIDGQIYWPPTLDNASGTGGKPVKNPMFDYQSYFSMQGGTYSYRYLAFEIADIDANLGKILTGGLPGKPPALKDGRNWLVTPTLWQRRGPVYELVEQYWMSDAGGWAKPVYGAGIGGGSVSNGIFSVATDLSAVTANANPVDNTFGADIAPPSFLQ